MLPLPDIFSAFHGTERSQGRSTWHSKAVRPRDRCCFHLVLAPYELCCTLSDNHAGRHRVAGCHARHDGSIRDAKVLEAMHPEMAIDHRHRVAPHFCGGCLMPKAKRCVADVVFQLWTFQAAGNDLSADKRTKSVGVTYLPTKFYACESCLSIIWVTEIIRFNLNGIGGIGTCKAYTTTTLRLNDIADQDPTSPREAKSCCVPSAKHSRQTLEVGAT